MADDEDDHHFFHLAKDEEEPLLLLEASGEESTVDDEAMLFDDDDDDDDDEDMSTAVSDDIDDDEDDEEIDVIVQQRMQPVTAEFDQQQCVDDGGLKADEDEEEALAVQVFDDAAIFLGGKTALHSADWLRGNGISHVINVTREVPFPGWLLQAGSGVQAWRIPVNDSPDTALVDFFDDAADYIDRAVSGQQSARLLVMCRQGRSRSPAVILAYAMKCRRMPLRAAYDLLLARRPQMSINFGFKHQLSLYEKRCFDGVSSLDFLNGFRVRVQAVAYLPQAFHRNNKGRRKPKQPLSLLLSRRQFCALRRRVTKRPLREIVAVMPEQPVVYQLEQRDDNAFDGDYWRTFKRTSRYERMRTRQFFDDPPQLDLISSNPSSSNPSISNPSISNPSSSVPPAKTSPTPTPTKPTAKTPTSPEAVSTTDVEVVVKRQRTVDQTTPTTATTSQDENDEQLWKALAEDESRVHESLAEPGTFWSHVALSARLMRKLRRQMVAPAAAPRQMRSVAVKPEPAPSPPRAEPAPPVSVKQEPQRSIDHQLVEAFCGEERRLHEQLSEPGTYWSHVPAGSRLYRRLRRQLRVSGEDLAAGE